MGPACHLHTAPLPLWNPFPDILFRFPEIDTTTFPICMLLYNGLLMRPKNPY